MIRPHRRFCICGNTARMHRMVLINVSSTPSFHLRSSSAGNGATGGPPAFATRMSIRPNRLTVRATSDAICRGFVRSALTGTMSPACPSAPSRISFAACDRARRLREQITRWAPSRANPSAAALPSPWLAAHTMATRPCSPSSICPFPSSSFEPRSDPGSSATSSCPERRCESSSRRSRPETMPRLLRSPENPLHAGPS